jgi:tetratricopeptide (TPR) repeat protein
MKISEKITPVWAGALFLAVIGCVLVFNPANADVAPPESPPGVIISPDSETTNVRMMSEAVTLTVISSGEQKGKAKTTALFIMRNLGNADENIDVRFPLTFGEALYYDNVYPEINDFKVQVVNRNVQTTRTTSIDASTGKTIPWASFPVRFPAGEDVKISATYTAQGFGYEPFLTFRYILETGAGWKDSIGEGDFIVQLPYDASRQNVLIDPESGFSKAAGEPVFAGNQIRWHFENLEPSEFENFQVEIISPLYWKKILAERENTVKNSKDGEAWGRLGKAIKESIRYSKGYLREDEGGKQLYSEAIKAYEKAVSLLPKDALWHFGFADLLWSHYLYSVYYNGSQDYAELTHLVSELQISLQIDPTNQSAKEMADWISGTLPWALSKSDHSYDYLVLTATPTIVLETSTPQLIMPTLPLSTEIAALPTILPEETITPPVVDSLNTTVPTVTESVSPGKTPICGSILFFPLIIGLIWFASKRW